MALRLLTTCFSLSEVSFFMVNIKIVIYGNLKDTIDTRRIIRWKSKLFSVSPAIAAYCINTRSDISNWGFSDKNLKAHLPSLKTVNDSNKTGRDADLVVYLTNIPLENNFFSRIISSNQVVVTVFEVKQSLNQAEIPLENYIIAMLYSYSLMFISSKGNLSMEFETQLAHNDARGCIFNNCGHKEEVVETAITPELCDVCKGFFLQNSVPAYQIENINRELKGLNRSLYFRISHFIKRRPLLTLIISALTAIFLNVVSGIILNLLTNS